MNSSRLLGNNISLLLREKSMNLLQFASIIGFQPREANKLIEGRLFVPPMVLGKIAESLDISIEELLRKREQEEYNTLIHNFKEFTNSDNQELVLNLIDMYADLEEATM